MFKINGGIGLEKLHHFTIRSKRYKRMKRLIHRHKKSRTTGGNKNVMQ